MVNLMKGQYMASRSLPKRVATAAAAFGVTAIVGTAPALATTVPGENIFGSGSSLQKIAQVNVWTTTWTSTASDHATLSNDPTATYFSSSSGHGLDEFGNNTAAVDLTQDGNADNGSTNGYGRPVLDAFVGTDDPPTGPLATAGSQLHNASLAATGGASRAIDEITVPVAQAPVAILLSVPTGITLGAGTAINLSNSLLRRIWDANVAADAPYAAKTWGALLMEAGVKRITSGTPGRGQFTDAGGSSGGSQGITLQVRSSASGTSYTFKGFLNLSGDANYPQSFVVDDDTWPVPTTNTGNTGGSQLVADTTATPGSIGYANLADARAATPAYSNTAQTTTTGGSHQFLYARVQSNEGSNDPRVRGSPIHDCRGSERLLGNQININGAHPTFVGHWTVPLSGSTFVPTGSWGGTLADDPDVYDHSLQNGKKTDNYPIVAVTYDLAWNSYHPAGSNIVRDYGGSSAQATPPGTPRRAICGTSRHRVSSTSSWPSCSYSRLPGRRLRPTPERPHWLSIRSRRSSAALPARRSLRGTAGRRRCHVSKLLPGGDQIAHSLARAESWF